MKRIPHFFRDGVRRDVYAVIFINRPYDIYINLLGDPRGVILLLLDLD